MELSRNLRVIMSQAFNTAQELKSEYLMPEHILYSIVKNDEEIVNRLDIDADGIIEELNVFFQTKVPLIQGNINRKPTESLGFNQVIQNSVQQVESSQRDTVEIGDIMIALFDLQGHARFILQKNGVEREDILEVVTEIQQESGYGENPNVRPQQGRGKKKSLLQEYTVELVNEAKEGRLDPIIGRMDEIERTVQILCRKKKNNPIHVGEPGVGKCLHAEERINLLVSDEMYEELKEFI